MWGFNSNQERFVYNVLRNSDRDYKGKRVLFILVVLVTNVAYLQILWCSLLRITRFEICVCH